MPLRVTGDAGEQGGHSNDLLLFAMEGDITGALHFKAFVPPEQSRGTPTRLRLTCELAHVATQPLSDLCSQHYMQRMAPVKTDVSTCAVTGSAS